MAISLSFDRRHLALASIFSSASSASGEVVTSECTCTLVGLKASGMSMEVILSDPGVSVGTSGLDEKNVGIIAAGGGGGGMRKV